MKFLWLVAFSATLLAKTANSTHFSFSLVVPDTWMKKEVKPKSIKGKLYNTLYVYSPENYRHQQAMVHRDFVYIALKQNTKRYDGILNEEDRIKKLEDLKTQLRQNQNPQLISERTYEDSLGHHFEVEMAVSGFGRKLINIVHQIITIDTTYQLFAITPNTADRDQDRQRLQQIIDSFNV